MTFDNLELVSKKILKNEIKSFRSIKRNTYRQNKSIKPSQEVILHKNYKWVLPKNIDDINYSSK